MKYFGAAHILLIAFFAPFCRTESAPVSVTTKSDYFNKFILGTDQNADDDESDSINNNINEINYPPNFIELYQDGVQAYLSNDWETCINHLERSVNLYRQYIETVATCRIQCEIERVRFQNTHKENYEHIHFYEKLIVKTLCLEKCRQKNLSHLPRYFQIDPEFKQMFRNRKPYEYLQLCYYQEGDMEKAISATYTVLVANPGDDLMKKNIKYYADQKEFDWAKIKDLEDKRYSSFFQDGADKYEQKAWKETIELIEIALDIWLQEYDKCRALCDGEFDQGWFPDFTTSVSNHYVYTLRCKQNCTKELSFTNGRYYDDFFPSMYNYLQMAYYNVGDIEEASRCAASYLLLYPNSEEMTSNIEFYERKNNGTSTTYLTPRKEAKKFYDQIVYETELLYFIDQEFSRMSSEPFRPKPQMDHLTDREIDIVEKTNLISDEDKK